MTRLIYYVKPFEVVMRFGEKNFIFIIAFVILGLLISVQFRSIMLLNKQKTPTKNYIEQLKAQINSEKEIEKNLRNEYDKKEKEKEENLKAAVNSKDNDYLKRQLKVLDEVKLEAGLTDVKGSGIIITLNDALVKSDDDKSQIKYLIIHDSDVTSVLNELKKAGAQALAINSERIIGTSAQVCAGPTISINNNRYPVPFEIRAIGNPDVLYDSVIRSEPVFYMLRDKIRVDIVKSKEVLIPKYSNNLDNLVTGLEEVKR